MRIVAAAVAIALLSAGCATAAPPLGAAPLYGIQGRMIAKPGQRDGLIAILLEGSGRMPGNVSYIVSKDAADPSAIWIHEVWDSRESHAASLRLPSVQSAIARARPLIAGFDSRSELIPVGGTAVSR